MSARLHIALLCGLRQGEALGLRWQDVDLMNGVLEVRNQIQMINGKLQLTGPLTAITAAVVGVVLNLTLFLSYHVFWPQGFTAQTVWVGVDGLGLAMATAAALALLRYKRSVMEVIAACAVLGWLLKMTPGLWGI
jgi:integrase